MKQLIPINTGGGLKPDPSPSAHLSDAGALVLNISADKLIGGEKWIVFYEDDAAKTPSFELRPAAATDRSAYKVTRSGGSVAKVQVRSLWLECDHAGKFVGRYSVGRVAHGLKLVRCEEA